jgi:hypothetical protein
MKETTDHFYCFETILKEVVAADFDQLVMVSRDQTCNLYMLSRGRVKKGITFEKDITGAFVEYFTEREFSEPIRGMLQFKLNTALIGMGKCFTVKITKRN